MSNIQRVYADFDSFIEALQCAERLGLNYRAHTAEVKEIVGKSGAVGRCWYVEIYLDDENDDVGEVLLS